MMPVLADLVSGRQPEMGVCQQSRQLYARDDDVDFSDDVYDQDTGDGNTRRPSLGISVGLSQSVVLVTSEIKFISESLSRVSTRNEGLHSAQYHQSDNDTGAKVCSTRCCSRRTTQVPPPALSVGWDRVDAGLRRRCATSPLHKILSTVSFHVLPYITCTRGHIHSGCILGTLLKQRPSEPLAPGTTQGQSELKAEVYFGPDITGARYVLLTQLLAVIFLVNK